jgi:hypothetical protein
MATPLLHGSLLSAGRGRGGVSIERVFDTDSRNPAKTHESRLDEAAALVRSFLERATGLEPAT